jgi:hypothetical protein
MNEDSKIINDTDKPLNQENIQPQKVDINVLKARAKELQDKENFRNAIFVVLALIILSWLERGTHKPEVSGSIPLPATILDDRYRFAPIVLQ